MTPPETAPVSPELDREKVRPEAPTTFYDGDVQIPGYGTPPERCRALSPVGFCEAGHTILGRSSCGTRYCPDHWRDWCEDAVVNAVARLAAYRHAVDGAEKRLSHIVASPPQDRSYSKRAMWDTRSEAYDVLEDAGVRGGVSVTHPYRTNERGDMLFETAVEAGEIPEETGRWAFLREVSEDWEDFTRYIDASPHYHTIAAAPSVEPDDAPEDWVVERIRTLKPFYFRDTEAYRAMVAPVYYVLTHGAVEDAKHTLTYFGDVHPASFDPEEELTAAVWSRIQIEAEKAVKETGEDAEEEPVAGPAECPEDGCEAATVDVYYLAEYMDDEEWVTSVKSGAGGREKWLRLKGMLLWWDESGDRPPPAVQANEAKLRNWLEVQGESLTPRERAPRSLKQQVSLTTALME